MNKTIFAKNTILDLAKRAKNGSKDAVERLKQWLVDYPEMRCLVLSLDAIADKSERSWIDRLAGADELFRMAIEKEVSAMKAELLGSNPSVADRVIVSSVIVNYLSHHHAAHAAASSSDPTVRVSLERVLSIAHKRLQDSIKICKQHFKLKKSNKTTQGNLKLFESSEKESGNETMAAGQAK